MENIIYARFSADFLIPKDESDDISSYAKLVNSKGEFVSEGEVHLIGYEYEDGVECDEEGNTSL
jgi:hypothetical protein